MLFISNFLYNNDILFIQIVKLMRNIVKSIIISDLSQGIRNYVRDTRNFFKRFFLFDENLYAAFKAKA